MKFIADILEENIKFNTDEILDVKWIDIDEIKNMTEDELRACDTNKDYIKFMEENRVYPLEMFNNRKYIRK